MVRQLKVLVTAEFDAECITNQSTSPLRGRTQTRWRFPPKREFSPVIRGVSATREMYCQFM